MKTALILFCGLFYSTALASFDLSNGLVAHYTFNGNADDSSGNGNHGVVVGASLTTDKQGNADGAYWFDGTSAYIVVPDSDILRGVTNEVTMIAWIKPEAWCNDSLPQYMPILCKGVEGRQIGVELAERKGAHYWVVNGCQTNYTPCADFEVTTKPELGEWHLLVVSFTSSQVVAYLDGVCIGTAIPSGAILKNEDSLYIGVDMPGDDEYFCGTMDEVRIYDRAFSGAEIHDLYFSEIPNSWTGRAGDGRFSSPGNWSGNNVPAPGAAVTIFCEASAELICDINFHVDSITFPSDSAQVTIVGDGMISGLKAITNVAPCHHTFNVAVSFADDIEADITMSERSYMNFAGGMTAHNVKRTGEHVWYCGDIHLTKANEDWSSLLKDYAHITSGSHLRLLSISNSGDSNFLIESGGVVEINGDYTLTSESGGVRYVTSSNDGIINVSGKIISGGNAIIQPSYKAWDGVIVANGLLIRSQASFQLNGVHNSRWVIGDGGLVSDSDEFWVLASGSATATLYPKADYTINNRMGVRRPLTIGTTDYFTNTIGRTITINGYLYRDSSVSITGIGKVVFNSVSDFAGGLTVNDTATLQINSGARPGSGNVTMASGTTFVLPLSESGGVSLGGNYSVSGSGKVKVVLGDMYEIIPTGTYNLFSAANQLDASRFELVNPCYNAKFTTSSDGKTLVVSVIERPTIANVTARQRYPWNGKVDISYTVAGDVVATARQGAMFPVLKVRAIDVIANTTNTATQLSGDMSLYAGTHSVVWDMDAEGLLMPFKSSNVVIEVVYELVPALYCVVDLSGGANAANYPITYMEEPPAGGFNSDEYKTTKLALRRIEPGSFKMCGQYNVALTKPYFCGIFEMTQMQYELVTGERPSFFTNLSCYATRPVETVSYDGIRGSGWPVSSAVDAGSFIGKLRAKTQIDSFDLPTDAQWEYACRGGTTTDYNNGTTNTGLQCENMDVVGRYRYNGGQDGLDNGNCEADAATAKVGSYQPNAWGLYDMHGNVWEWCLDWYGGLSNDMTDPKGNSTGSGRVFRGGSWSYGADDCISSFRKGFDPLYKSSSSGFRVVRNLSVVESEDEFSIAICSGKSSLTKIDLAVGLRTAASSEWINYSTDWSSNNITETIAIVEVNGELLNTGSGAGCMEWVPLQNGTYTLTHRVMDGDEQIGETLTATFIVTGLKPKEPVFSPVSGTTFDSSLTVSISCLTEGANIYYTTNGVDPTVDSTIYRRFRIYGKTTVKAIAEKDGLISEITTAEYAPGRCVDPVFSLADGAEFAHSNQVVTIRWNNDGVLRYTLDGTDPTEESPVYAGPFAFSDSAELRAKVFSDEFFESAVVTARLTRVWENVATPVIDAADSFSGSKAKVIITSATDGAIIHYTLDGSEPDANSPVYTGPIYVTANCTVKAYAEAVDYLDSVVVTKSIEKVWVIGDALGKPDHAFTTGEGGTSAWTRVSVATAPNGEAMRSGVITHGECSVLSTKVMGPGTLTFSWRTSCEQDPGGLYEWDHVELAVDDTVVRKLDGITAWTNETVRIEGDGEHAVEWRYVKDDAESAGEDAAWVAGYGWASDYTETQTTVVPVPYEWLLRHDPEIVDEFDAYEAAAKAENGKKDCFGNSLQVWQDYVAGTDPTDLASRFMAKIEMVDGTPIVTWEPDLNTNDVVRTYKVYGKETLEGGGEWQYPTNSLHRFFKVTVEMP